VNRSCRQVPFPSELGAGVEALRVAGFRAAAGRFAAVRVAGRAVDLRGAGCPVAALTIFGAAFAEARIALAGNALTEVDRRRRLRRTGPGRNALITADGIPDFRLRGTSWDSASWREGTRGEITTMTGQFPAADPGNRAGPSSDQGHGARRLPESPATSRQAPFSTEIGSGRTRTTRSSRQA
jgi:hypothetical protein